MTNRHPGRDPLVPWWVLMLAGMAMAAAVTFMLVTDAPGVCA